MTSSKHQKTNFLSELPLYKVNNTVYRINDSYYFGDSNKGEENKVIRGEGSKKGLVRGVE